MSTGHPEVTRLIADIGGTNARFALIAGDDTTPFAEQVLPCARYPGLVEAIESYLAGVDAPRPREAAIAMATPVTGDRIKMTNNDWSFSIEATRRTLGMDGFRLLNDFTALALALPHLPAQTLEAVGSGEAVPGAPLALLGPGTGLGVSGLIPTGTGWVPLQGEGGHVTFSPADGREMEILRIVSRRHDHVSTERLVSGGLGLENLYVALCELHGTRPETLSPAEMTERALAGRDPVCVDTLETFCAMLGTAAGNLVLTLGALGGVYIGGGIVPRLGDFFQRSPFRQRFEHRGRFSAYLAAVPCWVIHAKNPALVGAAQAFEAP